MEEDVVASPMSVRSERASRGLGMGMKSGNEADMSMSDLSVLSSTLDEKRDRKMSRASGKFGKAFEGMWYKPSKSKMNGHQNAFGQGQENSEFN